MSKTVVGIFEDLDRAEIAAKTMKGKGLPTEDISILAKYGDEGTIKERHEKKEARDNISDGVITGGILGGLAGLLIGAGSLVIPGLGIIAAAGPITGLLSGAVTGGIVGGLIDLGVPEKEGKRYEAELKQGKVLFSMRTEEGKAGQVEEVLRNNGAIRVETY